MANWKEVSGENNWESLLEPDVNISDKLSILCQRILQCGEGVQAIYDSITDEELPRHENKEDFSSNVNRRKLYEVKEYIYAWVDVSTPVDLLVEDRSAWVGYVAVATEEGKKVLGRRDILICWRGTLSVAEWQRNAVMTLTDRLDIFPFVHQANVHEGFYSLYTHSDPDPNSKYNKNSARIQVVEAVQNLVKEYPNEEISITLAGHSLGAALATLNAVDIVSNRFNRVTESSNEEFMVTVFTFGSPKVGDEAFRTEFKKLENLHLLQIKHVDDIIPEFPPGSYVEVQSNVLKINSNNPACDEDDKKKLSSSDKLSNAHCLKNYLRAIAGYVK